MLKVAEKESFLGKREKEIKYSPKAHGVLLKKWVKFYTNRAGTPKPKNRAGTPKQENRAECQTERYGGKRNGNL